MNAWTTAIERASPLCDRAPILHIRYWHEMLIPTDKTGQIGEDRGKTSIIHRRNSSVSVILEPDSLGCQKEDLHPVPERV